MATPCDADATHGVTVRHPLQLTNQPSSRVHCSVSPEHLPLAHSAIEAKHKKNLLQHLTGEIPGGKNEGAWQYLFTLVLKVPFGLCERIDGTLC
jgi:hypothetical protein